MRGFKDNIPPVSYAIEHVRSVFEKISKLYGCDFIDMPLVEQAQLYFRTSGESSDVCNKELFEVRKYKGEFEDWVLRPEGTASCMRAIKEASFMQKQRFGRFAYFAPMFRYNRPQKGRYRQFLHAGWELIGISGAQIDCEMIVGACEFLSACNLDYIVEVNSIGSAKDRCEYRKLLAKMMQLEEGTDPLKVLDKAETIGEDIPQMSINLEDAREFEKLCAMLSANNIKFTHNPYLVRGLDYYNSTVFEIKINGTTVAGGGRYDGLMEQIGGAHLPAIGFAAGIERIIENIAYEHKNKNIAIVSVAEDEYVMHLTSRLRARASLQCEDKEFASSSFSSNYQESGCVIFWGMSLKKALQEADKQGYRYVVIAGEFERSTQQFILKDLVERKEYLCRF